MRELSLSEAIREAMSQEMERDPSIILMGEDVGRFNGAFGVSSGMLEKFGPERIWDTPISEALEPLKVETILGKPAPLFEQIPEEAIEELSEMVARRIAEAEG